MSESATAPHPLDELITRINMCGALFATDLASMSQEVMGAAPGGKARTAFDIAFEVITVNTVVARYARSEPVEVPSPRDGWIHAPADFNDKERALSAFNASIQDLNESLLKASPRRLVEVVETPMGPMPLGRFAAVIPVHIMYHSGQLNYIQTLHGDDAMHWQ